MSEITKLYENAGIKLDCCKYAKYGYEGEEGPWYYCKKEGRECWTYPHGDADCVEKGYPPFTAEKQIELIKLLGNVRDYTVEIDKFKGVYYVGCRSAGSNDKLWGSSNVFEDALAELINETWFCLSEEEKQQVKGILE